MIKVTRKDGDSNQKIAGKFSKRAKRSNVVGRKRKTKNWSKPLSKLVKKAKAVRTAAYEEKRALLERIGKK